MYSLTGGDNTKREFKKNRQKILNLINSQYIESV